MQTKQKTQTSAYNSPKQTASLFTLLVYFKQEYATNGSDRGRKFHSDRYELVIKEGECIRDDKFAFDKLRAFVLGELNGRYKTAIIYDNTSGRTILQLSYNSVRIDNKVLFSQINNGKGTKFIGFA